MRSARTARLFGPAALVGLAAGGVLLAGASHFDRLPSAPRFESAAQPASQDAPAGGSRWLEFDPPPNPESITAFVVGYFAPGDRRPAFSFEVPRSRVQVMNDGRMRLPLLVGDLPAGRTYEIRLRSMAGHVRSGWSEPSGTFTVPGEPSASAPADASGNRSAGRARRARSAAGQLDDDPALKARLAKAFPAVDLAKAVQGYRSAGDLAADLFAARNLKIPFAEIKKLTADAGNRNLLQAIATLKPGADARAEQRRARQQARRLLGGR